MFEFTNETYPNEVIIGFVASDTKTVVYLKRCTNNGKYAVRVAKSNSERYWVISDYSLSNCMRAFAEEIAQYTGDFTTWSTCL